MKIKGYIFGLLVMMAIGLGAGATAKDIITSPTMGCKEVSALLLQGVIHIKLPGWKFENIEFMNDKQLFYNVVFIGPDKKKVTINIKSLKWSTELMTSTKYFTIGYKTENRSEQTNSDVERLVEAVAGELIKNENKPLVDEFIHKCSMSIEEERNEIPKSTSTVGENSAFDPTKMPKSFLYRKYGRQIAMMRFLAHEHKNTNIWNSVYVSSYIAICPFVFGVIIIALLFYVKICLVIHRKREMSRNP